MVRLIKNGTYLLRGDKVFEAKDRDSLCDLKGNPVSKEILTLERKLLIGKKRVGKRWLIKF